MFLSEKFTDLETINSVGFFYPKKRFPLYSKDRVNFIEEFIFNEKRDFYNWIHMEDEIKLSINKIFYSVHTTDAFLKHNNKQIFTLLIDTEIELACKHYFKLHPFWAGHPWARKGKEIFINEINECLQKNKNYTPVDNERILHSSSDTLLNKDVLDNVFYDQLVTFLELDNQYQNACHVFDLWKECNMRAEKNIVNFFINNPASTFAWTGYEKSFFNSGKYTTDDWFEMKKIALDYYARSN
jgi:hypothetical protein